MATSYPPFALGDDNPFPTDSGYNDPLNQFTWLGLEKVGLYTCYHIQLTERRKITYSPQSKVIKNVINFWLNINDSIPVQYDKLSQKLYKGDTSYEFVKEALQSYHLNDLKEETTLTLASIPSYFRLKEYTPTKPQVLLPAGTIAPEWSLPSAKGDEISLNELKGHPVLIDFFYKSCLPCMEALPTMRALNEKYKKAGLKVIGFNSFDKKDESLLSFLKTRNISYPVVLNGAASDSAYHVSRYPTIYLLDKEGKILYSQVGFGENDGKILEELIKKNL